MKCPLCNKGKIIIKEIEIEERKYLIEACSFCENCAIIYLHDIRRMTDETIRTKIK